MGILSFSSIMLANFREEVRITIPAMVETLKDSSLGVRMGAIEGISRLAVQSTC